MHLTCKELSVWRDEPRVDWQRVAAKSRSTTVSKSLHGVSCRCQNARAPHKERLAWPTEDG